MNTADNHPERSSTIPGRWVVLGMIAFGLITTAIIWGYWNSRLAPFLPLQKAIMQEFPGSYPHVEGGRPKGEPPLLRIVMHVDFAPSESDERVTKIVERVIALAKQNLDLGQYENFELHLVHYVPEQTPQRVTIRPKVSELNAND